MLSLQFTTGSDLGAQPMLRLQHRLDVMVIGIFTNSELEKVVWV